MRILLFLLILLPVLSYGGDPFPANKVHPEISEGEIYLGDYTLEEYEKVKENWQISRLGPYPYGKNGYRIKSLTSRIKIDGENKIVTGYVFPIDEVFHYPVFVPESEYNRKQKKEKDTK